MNYFYGTLFFELVFIIFGVYKGIVGIKAFKKEKKKVYFVLVSLLIPLIAYSFLDITMPKIKDLKYAINKDLLVYKGRVDKTYITGYVNTFILDGKEYQYNPWEFKPEENNEYKLYYLPNSKFVIKYIKEK